MAVSLAGGPWCRLAVQAAEETVTEEAVAEAAEAAAGAEEAAAGAEEAAAGAEEAATEVVDEAATEAAEEAATEAIEGISEEEETEPAVPPTGEKVVLRICNWEEYIDLGDWDEEETIDLDSGDIIGENSMIDDFEAWYLRTYGIDVDVEYSTFGTNEDLYNMLTLGDVYDLVCPSEYMFMKLIDEGMLVPLSDSFYDETVANNYYARGLSPYIRKVLDEHDINGEAWSKYAAGYMWGITGIVYNPEEVTHEEASTWSILNNGKFERRVTLKDNVRDSYFAALGALKRDLLISPEFRSDPEYSAKLEAEMNDVSPEAIVKVQDYLQDVKNNAYSFETDSGKADMITGKVLANYQWSGDAVYTLDQAEEDDFILNFAVPEESTNIYFDGWVILKSGISEDPLKQHAAEAFINFCSRPDNVVRNMYYIGYTSVIAGGDDERVFEYLDWTYGAEEDDDTAVEYPVGYFFSGNADDPDYVLTVPEEQLIRQLGAQYPSKEAIARSSIMIFFDSEKNEAINQMWINVRCFNIHDVPPLVWVLAVVAAAGLLYLFLSERRRKKMYE
ncbi:MAG: extracellular solute-binding protein [Lachnospiraceae bacterium]|nr:extracellular solute-binding protein [Lachnospiraceae bacterium]